MRKVVIAGYATVDYVVHAAGRFEGDGTMAMRTPPDTDWPRAGGAVLYAGRQLADAGHAVQPLTWVGADLDGGNYRRAAAQAGLKPAGIAILADTSTTRCLLIYHPDGSHGCLLQAGASQLLDEQMALLTQADLLVLTAGPAAASRNLLASLPASARLAWIVKPDPACFPPDLTRAITSRADWLFCNHSERAWLESHRDDIPAGQLLFETRGGEGVQVEGPELLATLPGRSLDVVDATGAGDSFAGASLAALLNGCFPVTAAERGMEAAEALLRRRLLSPAAIP